MAINSRLINIPQDGEEDVDEEVGVATALKENTKRREDNSEDDLDDVAVCIPSASEATHWLRRPPTGWY